MTEQEDDSAMFEQEEDLVTRLLLRVHAANLPRVGLLQSPPDSFAIVTSVKGRASRSGPYYDDSTAISAGTLSWGQTEVIRRNSHPQWIQTFPLSYEYGTECYFSVDVCKANKDPSKNSSNPHSFGTATCEVGDILGSRNRTKVKRLPKGGVVFCRIELLNEGNQNRISRFQFQASILKTRKLLFAKLKGSPDTIFQISKRHQNAHRHAWITVYRSSPVKESFEPKWDVGEMDLEALCNGDLDRPLRLRVMLYKKKGRQDTCIGECETTLRMILNTQRSDIEMNGFQLVKSMKKAAPAGRLEVELAQVIDLELEQEVMIDKFDIRCSLDNISRVSDDNPYEIDITALPPPMTVTTNATLQDYINDGLLLDFMIAIDFTSSNGDPRVPGTLHDQSTGNLNDYEESIVGIGTALAKYSEKCTVWGFGAKFGGVTRHLFQLGNAETVHGSVEGILDAYKGIFQSDLIMSGPTMFDQVIQAAAVQANKHKQAGSLRYCVLLILTDGMPQEIEETKRKLSVYVSVPMSVIFVGLGRSGFGAMYDLTSQQPGTQRKNSTFVEFRSQQHNPTSLGKAALQDMPTQLVEYMVQNNIHPSSI